VLGCHAGHAAHLRMSASVVRVRGGGRRRGAAVRVGLASAWRVCVPQRSECVAGLRGASLALRQRRDGQA